MSIAALFDLVREACPRGLWAKGVMLARDEAVSGDRSSPNEIVFRVHAPERAIQPTVVLYPADEEWECDCNSKYDACDHVAAAVIALKAAREAGADLPQPRGAGLPIGYELIHQDDELGVRRFAVGTDGERTTLGASLQAMVAGRVEGPAIAPTNDDLDVDRLLEGTRAGRSPSRDGAIPLGRLGDNDWRQLLSALAGNERVTLNGKAVECSGDPVLPVGEIRNEGKGVVLEVAANPELDEVVAPGLGLCDGVLRPLGETAVTGRSLEELPLVRRYLPAEYGELVGSMLPAIEKQISIAIRTSRLPTLSRDVRPRIHFEISQVGPMLSFLPTLVYGDPPAARIDGDRLIQLGGEAPVRDLQTERSLRERLRLDLHLAPGRRVELAGKEAAEMISRLRTFQPGDPSVQRAVDIRAQELLPALEVGEGTRTAVQFSVGVGNDRGTADAAAVVAAWQSGAELVPLLEGGFARVPGGWLEQYGHLVLDILEAKSASEAEDAPLPLFAVPALAQLCEALDTPPPADLSQLTPLLGDFEQVPEAPLPDDLNAELRPYQRRGVDWLCFLRKLRLGGLLADDMGLGKTLQALCAMTGRSLVVAPTSVVPNWAKEIARFRPGMKVSVYHGDKRELDPDADITLTTYALLRLDIEALCEVKWSSIVLDEAQAIKNPSSQVARAAFRLDADFRMALSGTPVENRLDELWSQFHFTNPGLLGGREPFKRRYAQPIGSGDESAAAALRRRIRPFLLRRLKADVAPELPPRTEVVMSCELDEDERAAYDAVRLATQADVVASLKKGGNVIRALETLLRLRQASCHTGLLPNRTADRSSKVDMLIQLLDTVVAEGHKAVVFSQWTSFLDRVEPHLTEANLTFTRLDGSTRDRGTVVSRFQSADGPPILIASLKAGGTGLNLTAADHVFLLDPWWNPAVEEQAADRAHRIGQDRPVMVYRLVSRDTVEERILVLQDKKRALAQAALAGAEAAASLTRDDLLALLED